LLILFSMIGLFLFLSPPSLTSKLQLAFIRIFKTPLELCNKMTYPKPEAVNKSNLFDPYKYIQLRNHLANNIQLLHEQRQQLNELNQVSSRYAWNGANFVPADVITFCIDASRADMIINRGRQDGLTEGQFVLGDYAVIGTIAWLDERTACIRLLTDPASKLAVTIGQSDIYAVLEGVGNNQAQISLLPTRYSVNVGDIVYARKKAGLLDASIIAGSISECKRSQKNPLVWDIGVLPACNFKTLEKVTVVVPEAPQRFDRDTQQRKNLVKEIENTVK